jgi:metal-responsive CopG/Arc/MetJ family transcriptional regulator
MAQIVARIDDSLASRLDEYVASGQASSRSDAVRVAIVELIERHRREEIGRQIVAGYKAIPQTEEEVGWSTGAASRMILEEPW